MTDIALTRRHEAVPLSDRITGAIVYLVLARIVGEECRQGWPA